MANTGLVMSDKLVLGFVGGPTFSNDVTYTGGGFRWVNQRWDEGLKKWNASHIPQTQALTDDLVSFFRIHKGGGKTFLVDDPLDRSFTQAQGILGTGAGNGMPSYQLYKQRMISAETDLQKITRPKTGTLTPQRNSVAITFGAGAGNIAVDYTTGVITFVADASQVPTSITVGASTVIRVSGTDNLAMAVGKLIYMAGVTGTAAAVLNGYAWTITAKSGTGPWDYTIGAVTTGLTVTGVGTIYKYPQASDTLTCAGGFYTPACFLTDEMRIDIIVGGPEGKRVCQWNDIPMMEDRE
jgi:uncharacterized protein (TIGR02217 family)